MAITDANEKGIVEGFYGNKRCDLFILNPDGSIACGNDYNDQIMRARSNYCDGARRNGVPGFLDDYRFYPKIKKHTLRIYKP